MRLGGKSMIVAAYKCDEGPDVTAESPRSFTRARLILDGDRARRSLTWHHGIAARCSTLLPPALIDAFITEQPTASVSLAEGRRKTVRGSKGLIRSLLGQNQAKVGLMARLA
jgi:hypothetical protein